MSPTPVWRRYHEATKHTPAKLRASRHFLDWANMPAPFRVYQDVPVLDLPAAVPPPRANALDTLRGCVAAPTATTTPDFLSQLLFHAAAVSATKIVPSTGYRYALRVNPSSGNLHPTEFHFATRGLPGWPDGLYHYRAASHEAEQRGEGDFVSALNVDAPLVFVLTSIAWREAWKYQSRAYRYCCHDIGHAWEALVLAARACGYPSSASGLFEDDAVATLLGLHDEWPMLILAIHVPGEAAPSRPPELRPGLPNQLSEDIVSYPLIDEVHLAAKQLHPPFEMHPAAPPDVLPAQTTADFAAIVRNRRSALDFEGGSLSMTADQLRTILAAARRPLQCDFARLPIDLRLYVHRVDGIEPGLYDADLNLLKAGDQRVMAAALSLSQDLAGNACVAFSMLAPLNAMAAAYGDRAYRYAHFLAGAVGHRMYIASEALGFRSTGIGAFFDDAVHEYLGDHKGTGEVIYHFAIGHPVHDPRLSEGVDQVSSYFQS